jgi:hypothetical protein
MISRRSAISIRKALQQYHRVLPSIRRTQRSALQLGMWLPYFERLNRRFIVITCYPSTVSEISELTSAPVVIPRAQSAHGALASGRGLAEGGLLCAKPPSQRPTCCASIG